MKPYSQVLLPRIPNAVDRDEGSLRQVACRFSVSASNKTLQLAESELNGVLPGLCVSASERPLDPPLRVGGRKNCETPIAVDFVGSYRGECRAGRVIRGSRAAAADR